MIVIFLEQIPASGGNAWSCKIPQSIRIALIDNQRTLLYLSLPLSKSHFKWTLEHLFYEKEPMPTY
jgi:hypothetical protein